MTGSAAQASHREVVYMPGWANLLLFSATVACVGCYAMLRGVVESDAPAQLLLWDLSWAPSLIILLGIPIFLGRLVIELEGDALIVRFGFVSIGEVRFPVSGIECAEPVAYRPLRQFGGWGWRVGKHAGKTTIVYSLRGRTGVILRLRDPIRALFRKTDRVLIGSLCPEALARALTRVIS